MRFVIINRDPQRTIIRQQPPDDLQPVAHQGQPDRMLHPVVVMRERAAGVIRRINKHALHLPRKLRLQSLQRQQVVSEDELVIEDVANFVFTRRREAAKRRAIKSSAIAGIAFKAFLLFTSRLRVFA